jgi:hypothetical protein
MPTAGMDCQTGFPIATLPMRSELGRPRLTSVSPSSLSELVTVGAEKGIDGKNMERIIVIGTTFWTRQGRMWIIP